MLTACAFDLGNTLSDDTTLLETSLRDVTDWLRERGAIRDPAVFAATYRRVHEATRGPFISHTYGELVFFEETFRELCVRGVEPHEALAWYRARVQERTHIDPELPDVLAWLRAQGLRIGVISNERTERVGAFLDKTGLSHAFDVVVVSEAVRIEKPDERIFRIALERLGTPASGTALFGDSVIADGGCRAIGMTFVLVTQYLRKGWGWEAGATNEPDEVVDRITRANLERVLTGSREGARHG